MEHLNEHYHRVRGIGSRSVLIILLWGFLLGFILSVSIQKMNHISEKPGVMYQMSPILCIIVFSAVLPSASLLAEVFVSRYELVSYSLKAMWLLSVLDCVANTVQNCIPDKYSKTLNIVNNYIIIFPRFFVFGTFLPGAIPLGLDQIVGGTNANISAFILWLAWSVFCGLTVADDVVTTTLFNCLKFRHEDVDTILSLLSVLFLSVGLMLDFFFNHKLVKEPVTVNPVTHIYKVLKYAAKHKYPIQRSAFTYCDDKQPTRLDYGKTKYGGPFTTEQVEDVKTFFRMVLVNLVIALFSIPLQAHYLASEQHILYDASTHELINEPTCSQDIVVEVTKSIPAIIYYIPLYEFIVFPCLKNRSPNIFKSTCIGAAIITLLPIYGVVTEALYYSTTEDATQCVFTQKSPYDHCFYVYIPFKLILGFATIILFKSTTEFVCAQAPYNVRGILIGLYLSLYSLLLVFGYVLHSIWRLFCFNNHKTGMCGIWFYLNVLVVAVVSLVLLGCVVRWYKARERDDIAGSQNMVEEIYHRYHEQEAIQ